MQVHGKHMRLSVLVNNAMDGGVAAWYAIGWATCTSQVMSMLQRQAQFFWFAHCALRGNQLLTLDSGFCTRTVRDECIAVTRQSFLALQFLQ